VSIDARHLRLGKAFPSPEPVAEGAAPATAAPAEPRRGLRLASEAQDGEPDDGPPHDSPGSGARPSLKRVK
ncbi:MAG: ClpXP protease specificity-enhancing factor, partial [Burkholderiaceae bacterium]|nr:ClpXP protease specificity-enhancing factor [Burkholderiaceae bacterium]